MQKSLSDLLFTGLAVVFIAIAGAFAVDTSKVLLNIGQQDNKVQVRSDLLQDTVVILQGAGLLTLTLSGFSTNAKKALDDLLTSIPNIAPMWHPPAKFLCSLVVVVVAFSVNQQGLPFLRTYYFKQGLNYLEDGELSKAKQAYLQAKKFPQTASEHTKVSLNLAEIYEQEGNIEKAIEEYKEALETDNPRIMLRLGRAMLFQELQEAGWSFNGQIPQVKLNQIDTYFQVARNSNQQIIPNSSPKKEEEDQKDEQQKSKKNEMSVNAQLNKDLLISQGVLDLVRV
jgi:tetratricopeptide (TPR) repeat protein